MAASLFKWFLAGMPATRDLPFAVNAPVQLVQRGMPNATETGSSAGSVTQSGDGNGRISPLCISA